MELGFFNYFFLHAFQPLYVSFPCSITCCLPVGTLWAFHPRSAGAAELRPGKSFPLSQKGKDYQVVAWFLAGALTKAIQFLLLLSEGLRDKWG